MADILFRMAAKTDVGLIRTNNEDNFQASADLSQSPMRWVNNQQYSLGPKGALLVVADGMGGMNAGEVASEIAINTVIDLFSPDNITDEVAKSHQSIEKFMKGVVREADSRIKQHAKEFPESRGMGTTIVIAWLFGGYTYVAWCGDSRAYIYNPATGLFQISKDHSYVQSLVDEGKLTKEEAFDFPDSNIITRSLCDGGPKAQPECLTFPQPLCDGDIILLCSDGLNGMIRDEEIEKIITHEQNDLSLLVDLLIGAAKEAGGADNVTVALAQITSGGEKSQPGRIPYQRKAGSKKLTSTISDDGVEMVYDGEEAPKSHKWLITAIISLLLLVLAGLAVWRFYPDIFGGNGMGTPITNPSTISNPSDNAETNGGDAVEKEGTNASDDIDAEDEEGSNDGGGGEVNPPEKPQPQKEVRPVRNLEIPSIQHRGTKPVKEETSSGGKPPVQSVNPRKNPPNQQSTQPKEKEKPKNGTQEENPAQGTTESPLSPTRSVPPGLTPIQQQTQPTEKPESQPKPDDAAKPREGGNIFTPIPPRKGGESSEMIEHVVKEGETLSSILRSNDKKLIKEVAAFNNIDPDRLVPGKHIYIYKRRKR